MRKEQGHLIYSALNRYIYGLCTHYIYMCENCLSPFSIDFSQVMLGTKFYIHFWLPALGQEQSIHNQVINKKLCKRDMRISIMIKYFIYLESQIMQFKNIVNNISTCTQIYILNLSFNMIG